MMAAVSLILLFGLLFPALALRKVNLYTETIQDNAVSWVNNTAETLDVDRIDLTLTLGPNAVLGDVAEASLDEIPAGQRNQNNSRSHILGVRASVTGGTGGIVSNPAQKVMYFAKGQLQLEPDESLFLNLEDVNGAAPVSCSCNIWYDD